MIPQPIDQVPLFLRLSEEERELIGARMRHLQFNTNDMIFSCSRAADMLGVVVQGWVKLEADSPQGPIALANLGAGSLLGDVDLLLNRPYSTSARAASATDVLALSRQDIHDVIIERPAIGLKFSQSLGTRVAFLDEYLVTQRLSIAGLLSSLDEDDLRAMAARLQFKSYSRGEVIFEAGDPGDSGFLIEEGSARLITGTHNGQEFEELKEGDLFGQTGLVTGKPFSSTARAVSDLNVWVLSRTDYQDLVREHQPIKLAFSRALAERLGPQDRLKAMEQLRKMPLFGDVDASALAEIASCLVLRHYPAGELIYGEGTPGDAVYFVDSGQVRLVSDETSDAEFLERKPAGEFFGEMALLTGRTRAEAAKAAVDTTLWVLYKSAYDELMVKHPTLSLALSRALSQRLGNSEGDFVERHLHKMKLFSDLSQSELKEVVEYVKPLRFRTGETICYSGQPAQFVYMIESGEVREIAGGASGQVVVLGLIGPQQSFGESAVVGSSNYRVTIQAVGDVACWAISKPDLDHVVACHPSLADSLDIRVHEERERAARRLARLEGEKTQQRSPNGHKSPPLPPRPPSRPLGSMQAAIWETGPHVNGSNGGNGSAAPYPRPPAWTPPVGVRTAPSKPWERPSTNVVRPMPAATARSMASPAPIASRAMRVHSSQPGSNDSPAVLNQFGLMSTGAKIKIGIVAVAAFWIVIVIPLVIAIYLLTSGALSGFFSSRPPSSDLPMEIQSTSARQVGMLSGKFAVKERTATPTPRPATPVPTAKPTVKPTRKPSVPTKAPIKQSQIPGGGPAADQPTPSGVSLLSRAPQRPALAPRFIDSRLGPNGLSLLTGVGVQDATVQSGQQFWRLISLKFEDAGAESGNDHTIYISIVDENNSRLDDQTVVVSWSESGALEVQHLGQTDQKPAGDYCNCNYNWPMYGAGYMVNVDGTLPSDKAYGMIMPEHRHVNYRLVFQRVTMP